MNRYLLGVSTLDLFSVTPSETADLLPRRFRDWFASRGWSPREHQLALLAKAREERSALLIAPTGAGKTLAGFLPTLVELSGEGFTRDDSSHLPLKGGGRTGNPFDPELVARFKAIILKTGNESDRAEAYRQFRGRDPEGDALLKRRGFPTK